MKNNFLKNISIIDLLNGVFVFVVLIFYLFAVSASPYFYQPLLIFAFAFGLIVLAVKQRKKTNNSAIVHFLVAFYPLLFLFIIFESFFMILPWFNPHDYDAELAAIDLKWLGTNPTVWIEQWVHPLLTDFFYLIYLFYFPLPLFILVWLSNKKMYAELDKSIFIMLLAYFIGYTGYFFFPVMGPRFYQPLIQLQTKDLHGVLLAVPIRNMISVFEPNKFDAFPSLHAAISLTSLLLMAKYNKKRFWIFLPIVAGIFVSVIYCRYHYVVDVAAGVFVSFIAFFAGNKIHDFSFKNFSPYYAPKDV